MALLVTWPTVVTVLDADAKLVSIMATRIENGVEIPVGPIETTIDLTKPGAELARVVAGLRAEYDAGAAKAVKAKALVDALEGAVAIALQDQEAANG